jgi:nucleolar protein 58
VEKILNEAEHSMGSEVSVVDMVCISQLCDQIVEMAGYRVALLSYLKERMHSLAPNLTILLGELMAAKLVHRAGECLCCCRWVDCINWSFGSGSLIKLAKLPASTIQLLGAENALFRALKKKQPTPKYGIIYHASLITHADGKEKARVSLGLGCCVSPCG